MRYSLGAAAYDASGVAIQSDINDSLQFQIGVLHSSIRELNINIDANTANPGIFAEASYGPVTDYVIAFCSSWPKSSNGGDYYAKDQDPMALPRNIPFEQSIEEMLLYFTNNYSRDPIEIRPDLFVTTNPSSYRASLDTAMKNLWKRKFDIQYIEAN